jgi:hypothetical protein
MTYANDAHTQIKITPTSDQVATLGRLGYFAFTAPENTIADTFGNQINDLTGDYQSGAILKVTDSVKPSIAGISATVDDETADAYINDSGVWELELAQNSVTSQIRVQMSEPVTVDPTKSILIPGTTIAYGTIQNDENDSSVVIITPASTAIGTAGQLGLTTFSIPDSLVCDLVDNDSSNITSPETISFTGGGLGNEATSLNLIVSPTPVDLLTALTCAKDYQYTGDSDYSYSGSISVTGAAVSVTYDSAEALGSSNINVMNDLARYLGALYWFDSGLSVKSVVYGGQTYTWDPTNSSSDQTGLKGSNWYGNGATLVSKIVDDFQSNNAMNAITLKITDEDSNEPEVTITFGIS